MYLASSIRCRVFVSECASFAHSPRDRLSRPCKKAIRSPTSLLTCFSFEWTSSLPPSGDGWVNGRLSWDKPRKGDDGTLRSFSGERRIILVGDCENCEKRLPRDCWLHKMSSHNTDVLLVDRALFFFAFSTFLSLRIKTACNLTLPVASCFCSVFRRCSKFPLHALHTILLFRLKTLLLLAPMHLLVYLLLLKSRQQRVVNGLDSVESHYFARCFHAHDIFF